VVEAVRGRPDGRRQIRSRSVFARKNYFYPDPEGTRSAADLPLCEGGAVPIEGPGGRDIGLIRIHIEEDAGKLIHGMPGGDAEGTREASLVDFNRSGVPLIEIVAQPEIRTADEAYRYLVRLRSILTYLDICDGNMEEGSLRCDANISVRPAGTVPFGIRAEVKNLNSFRNVHRALEHEIERQVGVLRAGGRLVQETRLWDEAAGATVSMRSKEEAHDTATPEPDLPPLEVDDA
jgi:aspartyl-tRNA(Asn)/glutamyl-tRNA(Gln) amidotransferase subunit B